MAGSPPRGATISWGKRQSQSRLHIPLREFAKSLRCSLLDISDQIERNFSEASKLLRSLDRGSFIGSELADGRADVPSVRAIPHASGISLRKFFADSDNR